MLIIEKQKAIIQYLLSPDNSLFASKNIKFISDDTFDDSKLKFIISLIKSYQATYQKLPSKDNLVIYLDDQKKTAKGLINPDVYNQMRKAIHEIYEPIPEDIEIIEEQIVSYVRSKKLKAITVEYSANGHMDDIKGQNDFKLKIVEALSIGTEVNDSDWEEINSSGFLVEKVKLSKEDLVPEGWSTGFPAWDYMTTAKGFHPPQFIIILAGFKRFKTGLMLTLARNYVAMGKKVYYADFDNNGVKELSSRYYQSLVGEPIENIKKVPKALERNLAIDRTAGGELIIEQFQTEVDTTEKIEQRLDHLKMWHNFDVDVIIFDYADKMAPIDRKIIDKRLKIQAIYADIANVLKNREALGFSLSQINAPAIRKDKFTFKSEDIAEDIAKIGNAHAIFAWNRTEKEIKLKLGRITPVEQRQGKKFVTAYFKVDEEAMLIEPLTKDQYLEIHPGIKDQL